MEMKGTPGVWSSNSPGYGDRDIGEDLGKPILYSAEQVEVLERVFAECPKPSGSQRLEIIRENPILSILDSKQIKVWFQNRRCCEKHKKEAIRFQSVNEKLAATKKLLLAENNRLQKELLQLVNENEYIRQLLQNVSAGTTCTTGESLVNSLSSSKAPNNSTGLLLLDEDAMGAFPSIATGSATDWVPIPRMKISNGMEENSFRACLKLIFTPTNEMLTDDAILLSSVIKTALTPLGLRPFPASPEVVALANRICQSIRSGSGDTLQDLDCMGLDPVLKQLFHHQGAVLSCSFEVSLEMSPPVCLFANQAGLHMLETTLAPLQDIKLDLIFCESDLEALDSVLLAIKQQGIAVLWSGVCMTVMAHFDI